MWLSHRGRRWHTVPGPTLQHLDVAHTFPVGHGLAARLTAAPGAQGWLVNTARGHIKHQVVLGFWSQKLDGRLCRDWVGTEHRGAGILRTWGTQLLSGQDVEPSFLKLLRLCLPSCFSSPGSKALMFYTRRRASITLLIVLFLPNPFSPQSSLEARMFRVYITHWRSSGPVWERTFACVTPSNVLVPVGSRY